MKPKPFILIYLLLGILGVLGWNLIINTNKPIAQDLNVPIAKNYYHYSQNLEIEQRAAGKTAVLYFWAPWCGNCAELDQALISQPDLIPQDTVVLRVDYDNSPELKKQYGVTMQHTFVAIDPNGELKASWVGGTTEHFIEQLKDI